MWSVHALAKINLFLNLRGVRADGFHEVCFLMQTLALSDVLTIERLNEGLGDAQRIRFTSSEPGLTDTSEENLVVLAYHRFFEAAGHEPVGLSVHLEKRIPIQAGLGGGSSDAASMLKVLNALSEQPVEQANLAEIAASLGSDVPFFLTGGTALATGRGEVIQSLPESLPDIPMLVVKPKNFGVPTPEAYRHVRARGAYQVRPVEPFLEAIRHVAQDKHLSTAQRIEALEPYLWNDFEAVLFPVYPALREAAEAMQAVGIRRPLLCGSGAAMAGFYDPAHLDQSTVDGRFPASRFEVFRTSLQAGLLPASKAL